MGVGLASPSRQVAVRSEEKQGFNSLAEHEAPASFCIDVKLALCCHVFDWCFTYLPLPRGKDQSYSNADDDTTQPTKLIERTA
jgi:hypothetical protein